MIDNLSQMADNIVEVCPGVYFGPYDYTYTEECVRKMTHIVNCCSEESSSSPAVRILCKWRHYPSQDHHKYPILENHLQETIDFLADAPQAYIHCYAGRNRSATLAIAVAHYRTNIPVETLIATARAATNRTILDNNGFIQQLKNYEAKCKEAQNDINTHKTP